ncbi:hypothetical protein [Nocardioides sp. LHG3406-4]|uniref:hypothetical protein n=1 Tax=Nocardioides sp. LHG3406-4 TaxID=2804575 RepID=UPI003CF9BBD0
MRPSSKPTGALWRLLEEWASNHPLDPNQRQLAHLFGVSDSLLSNWKYMESAMQTDDMLRVSEATGIAFEVLAQAVREDSPHVQIAVAARRSPKRPPQGPREQQAD